MSTKPQITFDDVEKHLKGVDLTQFHPGGQHHLAAAPSGTAGAVNVSQICPIYKVVKPIIYLVSSLPIFPRKWTDALGLFLQVMDVICPPSA